MSRNLALWTLIVGISLGGCAKADRSTETPEAEASAPSASPAAAAPAPEPAPIPAPGVPGGEPFAGWYMEHGSMGMFQTCGQTEQWTVDSAELRARAKEFGLEINTPVYVRVIGTRNRSNLVVASIEQFGADTPVSDCGLTGVVTPAPANNKQ